MRTLVTVLLRCRHCAATWRLSAADVLRREGRPPGLRCLCGSSDVEKVSVDEIRDE